MVVRKETGIALSVGSKEIGDLVSLVRPKYHITASEDCFYQRPPFIIQHTSCNILSRFINLAPVSQSKDKGKKYLHALSLTPITHVSSADLGKETQGLVGCENPYVPVLGAPNKRSIVSSGSVSGAGWEADSKRLKVNPPPPSGPPPSHSQPVGVLAQTPTSFFFNDASSGRQGGSRGSHHHGSSSAPADLEPPSATIRTLFIGGVTPQMTKEDIVQCLFPNTVIKNSSHHMNMIVQRSNSRGTESVDRSVRSVSRVEGKSFAFVECNSHEEAVAAVNYAKTCSLTVDNRTISVGWGKDTAGSSGNTQTALPVQSQYTSFILNIAPSDEGVRTLFVGNLPAGITRQEMWELFRAILSRRRGQQSQSLTLENIKCPDGRGYAFIEFNTPEEAGYYMDIALRKYHEIIELERAHQGEELLGRVQEAMGAYDFLLHQQVLSLGWAKGISLYCLLI